jgi:hypothetical protein
VSENRPADVRCSCRAHAGASFRHNLGCSHQQHEQLLRAIGEWCERGALHPAPWIFQACRSRSELNPTQGWSPRWTRRGGWLLGSLPRPAAAITCDRLAPPHANRPDGKTPRNWGHKATLTTTPPLACSNWRGYDASRTQPLDAPEHPLNSGDWKGAIDSSGWPSRCTRLVWAHSASR